MLYVAQLVSGGVRLEPRQLAPGSGTDPPPMPLSLGLRGLGADRVLPFPHMGPREAR